MKHFSGEQVGPAFRGEFSTNPEQQYQPEPETEKIDAQEENSEPEPKPKKRRLVEKIKGK